MAKEHLTLHSTCSRCVTLPNTSQVIRQEKPNDNAYTQQFYVNLIISHLAVPETVHRGFQIWSCSYMLGNNTCLH